MLTSIEGKSILIIGATRGIGLGIAYVLGRHKARIALTGRNLEHAETVARELNAAGIDARAFAVDVRDATAVKTLMQKVAKIHNGIDILCCNAGIFPSTKLDDLSEVNWDDVFDVNVKGSFLCVQAALPYLRKAEYGRIILTSSITGPVTGFPGWAHYGASKAAQLGFMRTAAIELARDNITMNAVLPGNIMTESLRNMGEEYLENMASSIPLRRLGSVEDVGNAVLFFASKEAAFITGQSIIIDGGQVLPESLQALEE
jgi:3-oxoacyl-[acyl-carrier protein] reductase